MFNYLVRRVALGLLTLLLITFLVYALIRLMPGSPRTVDATNMNPGKQPSAQQLEQRKRMYGLDKPWYLQYFVWLSNVARLDFGRTPTWLKSMGLKPSFRAGEFFFSRKSFFSGATKSGSARTEF